MPHIGKLVTPKRSVMFSRSGAQLVCSTVSLNEFRF